MEYSCFILIFSMLVNLSPWSVTVSTNCTVGSPGTESLPVQYILSPCSARDAIECKVQCANRCDITVMEWWRTGEQR